MRLFFNILILFSFFSAGLILGIIATNIHFLTLSKEFRLFEILNFVITCIIGLAVPLLIKKWIDDSRHVKNYIIEDIKMLVETITEINDNIESCYNSGSINSKNKNQINFSFHKSELQISSIDEQIEVRFGKNKKEMVAKIKEAHDKYWKFVTGGKLMSSSFKKIDEDFFRQSVTEYIRVKTGISIQIQNLCKK